MHQSIKVHTSLPHMHYLVSMYNVNVFPLDNVTEDGKEGENGGQRGFGIDNWKGNVVDLETAG